MPPRSWRETYFHRVRPAVGAGFSSRTVAIWDLAHGYLAAEALARTGLVRQRWFDDAGDAGGALCRSLGRQLAERPRARALEAHLRGHNHWEDDWALEHHPADAGRLRRVLRREPIDLLLAACDDRAGEVARAAVDSGTPLVMTHVPASGPIRVLQLVWTPDSCADAARIVAAAEALAGVAALDLDRAEHHLEGLEARSMGLSLGRWILTRSIPTRPDLERPIVEQGRALVARGQADWPWAVRFIDPGPAAAAGADPLGRLLAIVSTPGARYVTPPLPLVRRGASPVIVLGLGTASLFAAEAAGLLATSLLLVDCKEVTPVNPVRQVYATRQVGQPKGEALARTLAHRLAPDGAWEERAGPAGSRLLAGATGWVGHARLRVSDADPGSSMRLGELLDELRPGLAIVGMGRTHDDNFTATFELRRRGIRHITPSAFPGVTHFKHILTDGDSGPCYDCIQGHLTLDVGRGPALAEAERELFYGGSQPATLAETLPSAHSLLLLAAGLAAPAGARPAHLMRELASERPCFVGANRVEREGQGWLYGLHRPLSMVTFGMQDLLPPSGPPRRCSCGRLNVGARSSG